MSDLYALQSTFAQYLRTGELANTVMDARFAARAAVYRRLFFNNVFGLLSQAFPVTVSALDSQIWRQWIDAFFRDHVCHSPLFHELPAEFLQFANEQDHLFANYSAWLELMQYEYAETVIRLSATKIPDNNQTTQRLQLSPCALPLAYRYAVHTISATALPPTLPPSSPTLLLIWRDRRHRVSFQQLDPGAMQLAVQLQSGLGIDEVPSGAHALIEKWLDQHVVIQRAAHAG